MKPVHDTLEMVGIEERMRAIVPRAASAARFGARPRAIRSWTSGSPTPSSPMTATRVAGAPPRRSRSRRPSLDLLLRDAHDLRHRGDAGQHLAPAVLAERAHALLHRRVLEDVRGRALQHQ